MTTKNVRSATQRFAVAAGAASLLLFATQAPAQTPTMPKSQAEFEQMINLTPDQKAKIGAVDKKYQPQMNAVQAKYKPKFEALQKQFTALQQQANKEIQPIITSRQKDINTILTPAQKAKIKELEAAAARANPGGGRPQ